MNKTIKFWNNKFPLDYWWRKKYNVPYNSELHRAISPIDIAFEFHEEREMQNQIVRQENSSKRLERYNNTNKFLDKIVIKPTDEEIKEWVESLDDLDDYN